MEKTYILRFEKFNYSKHFTKQTYMLRKNGTKIEKTAQK